MLDELFGVTCEPSHGAKRGATDERPVSQEAWAMVNPGAAREHAEVGSMSPGDVIEIAKRHRQDGEAFATRGGTLRDGQPGHISDKPGSVRLAMITRTRETP
jgi:hypothetical protein